MAFSSGSTTGTPSRSPSPDTPDDISESVELQPESPNWNSVFYQPETITPSGKVVNTQFIDPASLHSDMPVSMDDMFQDSMFNDSVLTQDFHLNTALAVSPSQTVQSTTPTTNIFNSSNLLIPSTHAPGTMTKPVPPPPSVARKADPSGNARVVHPDRDSCRSLPIIFPSIPDGGLKSRVETQVRVTVDLADAVPSPSYNRVGSWNWLTLPRGTATKKRTRKQGKITAEAKDTLYLNFSVTCASPPHNPVVSCSSCQTREAKRMAKKIASRVRPAKDDSDSQSGTQSHSRKQKEDTSSIIQFNCAETVDFSTGSAVLPLRITCYCRHHREKVGFIVHFSMHTVSGDIVGMGSTRPIMITDDHKTSAASKANEMGSPIPKVEFEWSHTGAIADMNDAKAPSKRQKDPASSKKRAKPYEISSKRTKIASTDVSAAVSPASSESQLPATRSPTPPSLNIPSFVSGQAPSLFYSSQESESSGDAIMTPQDTISDVLPLATDIPSSFTKPDSSPISPSPYLLYNNLPLTNLSMVLPTIHRLIPGSGPTHGGIEVTILGANFHPAIHLNCVFGDSPPCSTQRWSDNALVCILPPRATAGVVAVWFDGFQMPEGAGPPSLFTYSDESDRALMELALQVVGLKMTGKIEDAKNVAMRIVGNVGDGASQGLIPGTTTMHPSASVCDLRTLLLMQASNGDDFEKLIIKFLSILEPELELPRTPTDLTVAEALSHPSSSGQTLLHLAAFLGFSQLTTFLVNHGVDLDSRDHNGFTALHFAAMKDISCARVLLQAGADRNIVNNFGQVATEVVHSQSLLDVFEDFTDQQSSEEFEEAQWGDDEDDVDDQSSKPRRQRRVLASKEHSERQSLSVSRLLQDKGKVEKSHNVDIGANDKQAASFVELIRRTLAHLPGSPNLPLPLQHLPHLPQLPGFPAVPWDALPQLPVFPVYIPVLPGWQFLLGGEQSAKDGDRDAVATVPGAGAMKSALEWKAAWEKFLATTFASQSQESDPPPQYSPAADANETFIQGSSSIAELETSKTQSTQAPKAAEPSKPSRRIGYESSAVIEQDVGAFEYQQKSQHKKHDRMLILFWIPILFLSLIWACHNGLVFAYRLFKTSFPMKVILRS